MTALTTAELILAALLALIVLTLAFIWLRRKVIARGHDLILGAIRTTADPRWRLGLIRLRGDQFEWFSVVGPRMRSERSWARHDLDLGAPSPVDVDIPRHTGGGHGRHRPSSDRTCALAAELHRRPGVAREQSAGVQRQRGLTIIFCVTQKMSLRPVNTVRSANFCVTQKVSSWSSGQRHGHRRAATGHLRRRRGWPPGQG